MRKLILLTKKEQIYLAYLIDYQLDSFKYSYSGEILEFASKLRRKICRKEKSNERPKHT